MHFRDQKQTLHQYIKQLLLIKKLDIIQQQLYDIVNIREANTEGLLFVFQGDLIFAWRQAQILLFCAALAIPLLPNYPYGVLFTIPITPSENQNDVNQK